MQATRNTRERLVSAWFPGKGGDSIRDLAPRAGILGSISIFGEAPSPEFFAYCAEHGIETVKLVAESVEAFNTPARARATVAKYVEDCNRTGYGGIDLDFEGLPAKHKRAYADFMVRLAEALHASGRRLSICVAGMAITQFPADGGPCFYDVGVIGRECDEVRVMCYDMNFAPGRWVGPTSTKPWARETMLFWRQHVPAEKLIMGLPAYGNDFDTRPGAGGGRQVGYDSLEGRSDARDAEKAWLPYERIHVYRYSDAEGHPHLFYASDGDSTAAHLETVDELDVHGISFWNYGSMTPGIWAAVDRWRGRSEDIHPLARRIALPATRRAGFR